MVTKVEFINNLLSELISIFNEVDGCDKLDFKNKLWYAYDNLTYFLDGCISDGTIISTNFGYSIVDKGILICVVKGIGNYYGMYVQVSCSESTNKLSMKVIDELHFTHNLEVYCNSLSDSFESLGVGVTMNKCKGNTIKFEFDGISLEYLVKEARK